MKNLRSWAKHNIERLFGYSFVLEPSSNLQDVRTLIRDLVPVPIEQALIRVGGEADGGYIVPDDFGGLTCAISPGVSTEIGFDLEMASRGIPVIMADASVDGPPVNNSKFHFYRKFVDVFEDENHVRVDSLVQSQEVSGDGHKILQMDIEGAEYRVILDLSEDALKSFRIMVIEFHFLDKMFGRLSFDIIRATFKKLLRYHNVVHIHPNNCSKPTKKGDIIIPPIMEFTFYLRNRAAIRADGELTFPNLLDRDNVRHLPSVILPSLWQRN